jgi:hypothetical protein
MGLNGLLEKMPFSRVSEPTLLRWTSSIKLDPVALVRERNIPIKRPQLFGEIRANVCG